MPLQSLPPFSGGGFVHSLVRVRSALPHVAPQGDQVDQPLQLPSSEKTFNTIKTFGRREHTSKQNTLFQHLSRAVLKHKT